jgi:hypothetical protein
MQPFDLHTYSKWKVLCGQCWSSIINQDVSLMCEAGRLLYEQEKLTES